MDEGGIRKRLQEAIGALEKEISSIRTGRATPALVENIQVSAYGGAQRLKVMEMANINAQDTQTIVIEPWDKSVIGEIRQAIQAANLGFNPSIDGEIIRISMPPLTSEDREKYVKLLGAKLENAKIELRQIRNDEMKDIKKAFEDKDISEDEKFQQEKKLQDIVDEFTEKVEKLGEEKEKELRG